MSNKININRTQIEARTVNPPARQVDCRTVDCKRKSFWIETDGDGSPLFCFRARHDGENHAVKLSTERIEKEMRDAGFVVTLQIKGFY